MTVDTESYIVDIVGVIGTYLAEKSITTGNPADNSGAEYENDVFLISAYDWRDDLPEDQQIPNFWYKPLNLQIEWYKHIGRGTFSNRPMPIDDAIVMFEQCIKSLQGAAAIIATADQDFYWEEEPDDE